MITSAVPGIDCQMSVRAPTTALYCVTMTTGLPTPPTAPTGLSNGQITEGELLIP